MSNNITDGIKKILLAGVGAAAFTAEKAEEIFDEMVDKGESTVERGKTLNRELKRDVKESDLLNNGKGKNLSKVVDGLSKDELSKLKELIEQAENKECDKD